jgi:hypothetical protein
MPMPTREDSVGELSHDARIAWRRDTAVGVDFVDEHHSIFQIGFRSKPAGR